MDTVKKRALTLLDRSLIGLLIFVVMVLLGMSAMRG